MKKFCIFGDPVAHSKSPQMQNAGFEYLNFNGFYEKYHLKNGDLIKEEFLKNAYSGANITVPHKEKAFKNADIIKGIAQKIEAVNTYILDDGKIVAYNTDAPGFLKAIESFGQIYNVLILGAGGTAKAIALALQEKNINVTVLNRSQGKLEFFKNHNIKAYSFDDFEKNNFKNEKFDLVVNSTSAGLKDDFLPVPKEILENILSKSSFAFDCIYGKITPFLDLAKNLDNKIKDGEDMLLYQGVLAFELFTNTKTNSSLIEAMRKGLNSNKN
ncbi:shikimate dehydrogenase [Aliarcobacter lanthieri]|uniref:shikimate dehydrogenase n=1 Tax=Aliarcobacter lanthieri TaxID=1355374 RepID=UPI003AACBFF3